MEFTDDAIADFIAIWERAFGERITADQARTEASLLMALYWELLQPLPGELGYNESPPEP